ncbi:hypothetical protein Tco_1502818 [Tanacetum coccineum]
MQAGSAILKIIRLPVAGYSACCCAATLAMAYSQMYNKKSRHLGVKHSMIRELITNRVVSIDFVRSQQNLADHLTKGLTRDFVLKSTEGMGLKSNQVIEPLDSDSGKREFRSLMKFSEFTHWMVFISLMALALYSLSSKLKDTIRELADGSGH